MNSIKTVFVLAVLGAIGYGVYVSINNNGQMNPPPGADQQWAGPPDIQMPEMGSGTSQFPLGSAGSGGQLGSGTTAPPFDAAGLATSNPNNGLAPAYPYEGYPSTEPGFPPAPESTASTTFDNLVQVAQVQLDQGDLAKALESLSLFYGDPTLRPEQNRRLTELLDQVAGTVIYSRQHLLEQPYKVRAGETLEQIARSYDVPPRLLAKINGIRDPNNLPAEQELKVIRGPFSAVIDLEDYELTLILEGRYAGRFRIGIGRQLQQPEGDYVVSDKNTTPASPTQGTRWIGLSKQAASPVGPEIGIHGTNNPLDVGSITASGSISLGARDIEDVYDILSIGSRVVIRR